VKCHSLLILSFFILLASSCTKEIGKVNYGDYPHEIGKLITLNCAVSGCHNTESYLAAGDYNLSTWKDMFSGASSGSPVIPYSSKFSSLCYAINTYSDLGIQTEPSMPLNKNVLSYQDVVLIQKWIDEGAPDKFGNVMWANDPDRKKLYAVNQGCDVVTVFDSETKLPIRYISVGNKTGADTPHHVRVSPDGKFWYVIFINNNIMQKFSCADDRFIQDIPLTPFAAGTGIENNLDWNTFVISKDSKKAYVVSWTQNGRVAAVDLENGKLLHYSGSLYYPHGIALNAAEDKFYVTAQTGNFITELDTAFSSATTISLDNDQSINYSSSVDPHDLILTPDGADLLITCQKTNEVRVLNLQTQKVTKIIPTGFYPQEIVYSKATADYFVSCPEDISTPGTHGVVTRIKANGYAADNKTCGFQPHGLAVDEKQKLLYVLSRNISSDGPTPHHTSQCNGRNGFLNFIDIPSFTVLAKRYELSVDPYFIFARP